MSAQGVVLTCDEVEELSGLYVLGALTPDEEEQFRAHLASCDRAHSTLEQLAPVVPGLIETIEPIDPPEELRASVLAAIAATPQLASEMAERTTTDGVDSPPSASAQPISLEAERARRRPTWDRWLRPALAAAAVVLIVALGATVVVQQRQASDNAARSQALQTALVSIAQPGAQFAPLAGSGPAAGATGIAAFPPGQSGTIVMQGLAPLSSDRTYQAWLIATGAPVSAGLMSVGSDGLAIEQGIVPLSGAQVVALTVENAGGAAAPTSDPIVVGHVQEVPAASAIVGTSPLVGLDPRYEAAGVASLAVAIVPGPWLRARSRAVRAAV